MADPANTPVQPAAAATQASPQPASANPAAFQLRGPAPRVMRLSRKALATLGVVAGLSIGGSLYYALAPEGEKAAKELYNTDSRAAAETITSGPKDYGQVPKLGKPLPGDLGGPIVSAQQRGQDVPAPPIGAQPDPRVQATEAARQRIAQERDAARTSTVFLGGGSAGAGAMPSLPGLAIAAPDTAAPQSPEQQNGSATQGDQAGKRAFMAQAANQRTVSAERLTAPASPNIVQAGSIIPAALITGIRSDLPGQITAQVTENIYDSPTGKILLVPQGTRVIGQYDSGVGFGQRRILLVWNRLIFPNGRSIVLERQPGADAEGYAGLEDGVDYHWGELFKAAALSTILSIGAEAGSSGQESDIVRALRQGASNSVSQTGQQIVQRQLNIAPTLTIRPGFPVRVIVTRDLVLEPYGG